MKAIAVLAVVLGLSGCRLVPVEYEDRASMLRATRDEVAARPERERASILEGRYRVLFGPSDDIPSLPEPDLRLRFQALLIPAAVAQDDRFLAEMEDLLSALTALKADVLAERTALRAAYIEQRAFDAASQLRRIEPRLAPVPRARSIAEDGRVTTWQLREGERLEQRVADVGGEAWVLVVGTPGDPGLERLTRTLEATPKSARLFAEHATWLVGPQWPLDLQTLAGWNRQHPVAAFQLVHHKRDWPMVNDWSGLSCFFMRGNEVVRSFRGWPEQGNWEALNVGLTAIGY